ncbi:hypothetical protein [Halovenus carboxidivorans]|nr:hypothetical protein [Halovenus carboxidivorans]
MVDAVVDAVGPFLIPVVLFGLGVIGYAVLLILTRWGILSED